MKLAQIISWLQSHKHDGTWQRISHATAGSGARPIHYDTIARIARGDIEAPSVLICERLADAILSDHPAKAA